MQTARELLRAGQSISISKSLSEIDKGFDKSISDGIYRLDCSFEEWFCLVSDKWKNVRYQYLNGESVMGMRDRVFPEFIRIAQKSFEL